MDPGLGSDEQPGDRGIVVLKPGLEKMKLVAILIGRSHAYKKNNFLNFILITF